MQPKNNHTKVRPVIRSLPIQKSAFEYYKNNLDTVHKGHPNKRERSDWRKFVLLGRAVYASVCGIGVHTCVYLCVNLVTLKKKRF